MNILALLPIIEALTQADKKVDDVDYFELTLIYPTSVCRSYDQLTKFITKETINNFCKVPADAAPWTIHGLW